MRVKRRGRATCRRTAGAREGGWLWQEEEVGAEGAAGSVQAVGEGSPTVPPRLLSGMQAGRLSVLHWPHLPKLSLQLLDWTQKREGQRQSLC